MTNSQGNTNAVGAGSAGTDDLWTFYRFRFSRIIIIVHNLPQFASGDRDAFDSNPVILQSLFSWLLLYPFYDGRRIDRLLPDWNSSSPEMLPIFGVCLSIRGWKKVQWQETTSVVIGCVDLEKRCLFCMDRLIRKIIISNGRRTLF